VVGPCRSGTTLFLNMLCQPAADAERAEVYGLFQPVKAGFRYEGGLDYRVYEGEPGRQHPAVRNHPGRALYLLKEAVGHSTAEECRLQVFPNDEAIRNTRPVFIFRDPESTWNSWKVARWGDGPLFAMAYRHAYDLYRHARAVSAGTSALTYEHLLANKEPVVRALCRRLGITFHGTMLAFRCHFLDNPNVWLHRGTVRDNEAADHHHNIANSAGVGMNLAARESLVTPEERAAIRRTLRPLYDEIAAAAARDYAVAPPTPDGGTARR
jgi:hypothetical protein